MSNFKREDRYLVIKISDAKKYLSEKELNKLSHLSLIVNSGRVNLDGKNQLKCVVVEHDWPEYEPTWKAIEARVENEKTAKELDK